MFNAEKLLGQVVGELLGNSCHRKKSAGSLLGGLTSGAGLMKVIGLGVGVYEILSSKQKEDGPGVPPPLPLTGSASPPLPPGATSTAPAVPPAVPNAAMKNPAPAALPSAVSPAATMDADAQEKAMRLIRVMIAATHADGSMDAEEEQAILERLKKAGLSQQEQLFLLGEIHQPHSIEALTAGINDPALAKTMYMLAAGSISIDTDGERQWLNQLAVALKISPALQSYLEEQQQ